MYRPDLGAWSPISSSGAPPAPAPAVWTGSDMIVFGSGGAASGKFNPRSNVWETISEIGAPNLESISDAVWTGSEAIVIGEIGSKPSGAVFNPTVNSWRSMDSLGLYLFRDRSWAPPVWTGSAMVLIGANPILKATLYDPRSNSWTIPGSLSPFDCFDCGISASVWTGSELLYHIPRDGFYYGFSPALELYLYQKQ